jgi:hypothetical protein
MIIRSLSQQLEENIPCEDAVVSFDFISDYLGKYCAQLYELLKQPYAVVLAIESILQNPNLASERQFDTVLRNRGMSAMESYCIEAQHFFTMSHQGNGNQKWRPLWRLEGDAMQRWSEDRRTSYTFHEAFWMAFLGRYACAQKHQVEILAHATIEAHARKLDVDTRRIDPGKRFGELAHEALRSDFGMSRYDSLPFDSWVQELAREVITKLGR